MNPIDRQILQIALPSIVSNITVPLLGLIDVAIVGHLGSPAYIGAIAVGGMLFNIIYWIFGFLRMGTSGMTSQAYGKRDLPEIVRLLIRSVGIGLAKERKQNKRSCYRFQARQRTSGRIRDTAFRRRRSVPYCLFGYCQPIRRTYLLSVQRNHGQ